MRLQTLELTAFGPFTKKTLDFSGRRGGFHLVFGLNEAGKSSALRALISLFYGIPAQTPDNFLHDHKALRIGARICHSDKNELALVRRKGLKNTLLTPAGDPLPEAVLDKYLGGVTREMFSAMFGLDQAELVAGGRAIVEGRGHMGESLFAAGMGITGMRDIMLTMEKEAGEQFKPNAKNPTINRLLSEHKSLKKQIQEHSLSAKEWAAHDKELKRALQEKESLVADRRTCVGEKNRLVRLQKAIPRIVRLKKLRDDLASIGKTVFLSPGFSDRRKQVQIALGQARSHQSRLEAELNDIRHEIKKIRPANPLVYAQADIIELFQRSGSYKKAALDLPRRRADEYRLTEEAQAILNHLSPGRGIDTAESFRLSDAKIAKLRKLSREFDPLNERETAARKTLSDLSIELTAARESLASIPEEKNMEALEEKIDAVKRQGDLARQLDTGRKALENRRSQAELELQRLGLWTGTLHDLEKLPLPEPATLTRFESGFAALELNQEQSALEMTALADRMADLDRRQAALNAEGVIPGVSDLEEARKKRDTGWQLVLDTWRKGTRTETAPFSIGPDAELLARAYEKSVLEADEISDRLRHESDRIAKKERLESDRADGSARKTALEKKISKIDAQRALLAKEWLALWQPLHIEPLPPKEMKEWQQKTHRLIEHGQDLRGLGAECEQVDALIENHLALLSNSLAHLGQHLPDHKKNLGGLILHCESVVRKAERAGQKRSAVQSRMNDIRRRSQTAERDLQLVRKDRAAWSEKWGAAIAVLGLDDQSFPDEVDAVLTRTQLLFERLDQADAMKGRIRAIEADVKEFAAAVQTICTRLAPDLVHLPPEEIVTNLNDALTLALENTARLEELEKQQTAKTLSIREEQISNDEMTIKLEEMCRQAEVDTPDKLPEVEKKSAAALDLQKEIGRIENELAEYSGGAALADFMETAGLANPDELPADIEELDKKNQVLGEMLSETDQTIGREEAAIAAMDGGGRASELAEKSQAVLAEIRNSADRYTLLQVTLAVLRKEIEHYREANQGPVLKRASNIFSRLTLSSFNGLVSDFDEKDNPVLMGLRPSNQKVPVAGMSDGTCDQLYLSLRLASLEQRLLTSEPMPLVMDDILINFDDERSAATLDVLAELSRSTQIIFFTHHRHLVELAKAHVDNDLMSMHALDSKGQLS